MNKRVALVVVVFSFSGCNSYPVPASLEVDPPVKQVRITPHADCEQLVAHLKQRWVEDMRADIGKNLEAALQPEECPGDLCGTPEGGHKGCGCGGCMLPSLAPIDGPSGVNPVNGSPEWTSGEPDFLVNDEGFLYLLDKQGLQVIDIHPPEDTRTVSRLPMPGLAWRMHRRQDRIMVLSLVEPSGEAPQCLLQGRQFFCLSDTEVKVKEVNISDRQQPLVERTVHIPAGLVKSFQAGSSVHIAVKLTLGRLFYLADWPDDLPRHGGHDREEATAAFQALLQDNEKRIQETSIDDWIPLIRDARHQPNRGDRIATSHAIHCGDVLGQRPELGTGVLSVVSFDPESSRNPRVASIVGDHDHVVFSGSALIATRSRPPGQNGFRGESTQIVKLSLGSSSRVSGSVGGRIASAVSIDEFKGHLRVATTNAGPVDVPGYNAVYVLGHDLQTVGSLTGIATHTSISATRFLGDKAILVTPLGVDGLMLIDLSEPGSPRMAGSIGRNGPYSMLQLLDTDHLFAFHQNGLEQPQLQLIDISGLEPVVLHETGQEQSSTRFHVVCNPLAFGYTPGISLLTIPVNACEGNPDQARTGGLLVLDVSAASGFTERGRIPFGTTDDEWYEDWAGEGCDWPPLDLLTRRSLVENEYIFMLSEKSLKVSRLDDPATTIRIVPLTTR